MSIPESIVREIERAIRGAEFPSGMSVHDGKAKVDSSHLRRLLAELAALRAELEQATADVLGAADKVVEWKARAEKAEAERDAAKALLQSGADVVTRGAQIMTLDQLSTWEGCRGFVEAVFEMCERAALGER